MESTSPVRHASGVGQAASPTRFFAARPQGLAPGTGAGTAPVKVSTLGREAARVLAMYEETDAVREHAVTAARQRLTDWRPLSDAQIGRIARDLLT